MNTHEKYMQRCIELALNGTGHVSPNPLVGCVIVYKNKIIGEGYHRQYGMPHAEVNAINQVKEKKLLKESILYVNLEPCCHHGKTPPCTDLILKYKIPTLVIGCIDSFTKVNGKGVEILRNAGCHVKVGIWENDCIEMNKRFFTFQSKKRPYIILKWAQTMDGFMDIHRTNKNLFETYWISNNEVKILCHKWRSEEDAIMVGTNTALHDNPMLTVRDWTGRNPIRIVIDRTCRIPKDYHIFDGSTQTYIITEKKIKAKKNVEYIQINFSKNIIPQILEKLYQLNILSLIVEGGKQLLESFIHLNMWDEATIQIGNQFFTKGLKAPILSIKPAMQQKINDNTLIHFRNNK